MKVRNEYFKIEVSSLNMRKGKTNPVTKVLWVRATTDLAPVEKKQRDEYVRMIKAVSRMATNEVLLMVRRNPLLTNSAIFTNELPKEQKYKKKTFLDTELHIVLKEERKLSDALSMLEPFISDVLNKVLQCYEEYGFNLWKKTQPILHTLNDNYIVESLENEEWKPVKGYEGRYEVSNLGRVKTLHSKGTDDEKLITQSDSGEGKYVSLFNNDGKSKRHYIHNLVAAAFLEDTKTRESDVIEHINGNKADNRLENLQWKRKPTVFQTPHQVVDDFISRNKLNFNKIGKSSLKRSRLK